MTISDATRQYWLDTVLGWAEDRLMPPQYDECKAALTQAAPNADLDTANAELEESRAEAADLAGECQRLRALLKRCRSELLDEGAEVGCNECSDCRLVVDIDAALARPTGGAAEGDGK